MEVARESLDDSPPSFQARDRTLTKEVSMATGTNRPDGRPSDPRDLIFEGDRETAPTHIRTRRRFQPSRIILSLVIALLGGWMENTAADRISARVEPIFPLWCNYIAFGLAAIAGFMLTYRLLRDKTSQEDA
jgi:hypothetical protein